MPKYLVTGGAGFIGSHIVDALVRDKAEVRVLDNLSTGNEANIGHLAGEIDFVKGDIRDAELAESVMEGIECVFHQAALPSVERSFNDPQETLSVNAYGTLVVLDAAKKHRVKTLVYASSSSVYAKANPYAVSKLLGEQYCLLYNKLYGLNTVCLRYFNVFGPRQNPNSRYAAVVPKFISALKNGKSPIIYGDGEQSRDFTYVRNVVEANLFIKTAGVYDIGCGESVTVNVLLAQIKNIMGAAIPADIPTEYAPSRKGDARYSRASLDRSFYTPKIGLQEGLTLTINAKTT